MSYMSYYIRPNILPFFWCRLRTGRGKQLCVKGQNKRVIDPLYRWNVSDRDHNSLCRMVRKAEATTESARHRVTPPMTEGKGMWLICGNKQIGSPMFPIGEFWASSTGIANILPGAPKSLTLSIYCQTCYSVLTIKAYSTIVYLFGGNLMPQDLLCSQNGGTQTVTRLCGSHSIEPMKHVDKGVTDW